MKYRLVYFIGMIFTFIIILFSLFGPWYSISLSAVGRTGTVDMTLNNMVSKIGGEKQIIAYEDFKEVTSIVGVNADELDIFKDIRTIVTTALFFTIIGIIVILWLQFVSVTPEIMRILGIFFCIIVFLLGFIACMYLMAGVFHEGESFYFTKIILGVEVTGGPGYGWFLMLTASIIALISSIPLIKKQTT